MIIYWTLTKAHELNSHDKAPKTKPYVTEQRDREDWQTCHHTLTYKEKTRRLTSKCGYDRGVRLPNVIKGLLRQGR